MDALLDKTFFHNARAKFGKAGNPGFELAHYTSAQALTKILKSRRIYLSDSRYLNDTSEVKFGAALLESTVNGNSGMSLFKALSDISPELSKDKVWGEYHLKAHSPRIAEASFIASFCEHNQAKISDYGKLSMWRYYGREGGVAMILDAKKFGVERFDPWETWTYPVEYVQCSYDWKFPKTNWVSKEFLRISQEISANKEALKSFVHENGTAKMTGRIIQTFRLVMLRTKHIAFSEEQEWRAIKTPYFMDAMPAESPKRVVVKNRRQLVAKLQLTDHTKEKPDGLNLLPENIVKKVLIGPCKNAEEKRTEIIESLIKSGFRNVDERVVITHIPLRPD